MFNVWGWLLLLGQLFLIASALFLLFIGYSLYRATKELGEAAHAIGSGLHCVTGVAHGLARAGSTVHGIAHDLAPIGRGMRHVLSTASAIHNGPQGKHQDVSIRGSRQLATCRQVEGVCGGELATGVVTGEGKKEGTSGRGQGGSPGGGQ
eukprot:scaffold177168_cov16-Tisochrysis_lutea.AAC.1